MDRLEFQLRFNKSLKIKLETLDGCVFKKRQVTLFKIINTPLSGDVLIFDPGSSLFLLRIHFLQMSSIPIKMRVSMEMLTY